MSFYSFFNDDEEAAFSPEDKAYALSKLRLNCLSISPNELIKKAELYGVLPALLERGGGIDEEKFSYITKCYRLMTELEQLMDEDDRSKFTEFLIANHDILQRFPPCELFRLLCWWGPAPACVAALLESPLGHDIDVNGFGKGSANPPLEAAATFLSFHLTEILLKAGADVNVKCGQHSTALHCALELLRSHKLIVDWTSKQAFLDLFSKLLDPDLKEAVSTINLLASRMDIERMLLPIVENGCWVELTLLLIIARPILLVPSGEWTLDNTPAAKFLSCRLRQLDTEERDGITESREEMGQLDDALAVVRFVWEGSEIQSSILKPKKYIGEGQFFGDGKAHASKIRELIADKETSFGRTLTKLMAEERGLTVDVEGFNMAMGKAWKDPGTPRIWIMQVY